MSHRDKFCAVGVSSSFDTNGSFDSSPPFRLSGAMTCNKHRINAGSMVDSARRPWIRCEDDDDDDDDDAWSIFRTTRYARSTSWIKIGGYGAGRYN